MEWDLTADVVCVGAGAGGLASTILAVDAGANAFIANFSEPVDRVPRFAPADAWPSGAGLDRTLNIAAADWETDDYLAALTESLDASGPRSCGARVPTRLVEDFAPAATPRRRGNPHPPFDGPRLMNWAADCAASPYGVVFSRPRAGATTARMSRGGTVVEVIPVGSLRLDPDVPGPALDRWLTAQAHDRRIEVHDHHRLHRLVFDNGHVIGAVFDTPTGTSAVRALHGVLLAPDSVRTSRARCAVRPVRGHLTAQVCMVREPVSRFSRMEIHVAEPAAVNSVGTPWSPIAQVHGRDRRCPAYPGRADGPPAH